MELKSAYWYKITYPDSSTQIFKFLDMNDDDTHRCELCDGTETSTIFRQTYSKVEELGHENPCQ